MSRKLTRKNLPKWTRPLTAGDVWHLKEMDCMRLKDLKTVKKMIDAEKAEHPDAWTHRVCLECNHIINKLKEAGVAL